MILPMMNPNVPATEFDVAIEQDAEILEQAAKEMLEAPSIQEALGDGVTDDAW